MNATSPENITLVNQSSGVNLTDIPKTGELSNTSDNGIFEDSSVLEVENSSILAFVNDLYKDDTEMTENFETRESGGSFTDDVAAVAETISSVIETICSCSTFGNNLENEEMKENVGVKNEESGSSELGQTNDSSLPGKGAYVYRQINDTEMTENFETRESGGSFIDDVEAVAETISSVIETICSSSTFGNNLENEEMKENDGVKNEESGSSELGQTNDSPLPGKGAYVYRLTIGEAINCPVKKAATAKSVKKAVAMRSRAPEMVLESLKEMKKENGVTFDEIISHIDEKYAIHAVVMQRRISQCLTKGLKRGEIVKIIGVNREVRYKIKQTENSE